MARCRPESPHRAQHQPQYLFFISIFSAHLQGVLQRPQVSSLKFKSAVARGVGLGLRRTLPIYLRICTATFNRWESSLGSAEVPPQLLRHCLEACAKYHRRFHCRLCRNADPLGGNAPPLSHGGLAIESNGLSGDLVATDRPGRGFGT